MSALRSDEQYAPRPQLRLVDAGTREQQRALCPVCEKPFVPFAPNGRPRRACTLSCSQQLRRREELERYGGPAPRKNSTPASRQRAVEVSRGPERKRVRDIIRSMPKGDRFDYDVEGCLPLLEMVARTGWVDEDTDPTLVGAGCPGCWKRDGSTPCLTCPSPPTREDKRSASAQRRLNTLHLHASQRQALASRP